MPLTRDEITQIIEGLNASFEIYKNKLSNTPSLDETVAYAGGFVAGLMTIAKALDLDPDVFVPALDLIKTSNLFNSKLSIHSEDDLLTQLKLDANARCIHLFFEDNIPPNLAVAFSVLFEKEIAASDEQNILIQCFPKDLDFNVFVELIKKNTGNFAYGVANKGVTVDFIGDKTWKSTGKEWVAA